MPFIFAVSGFKDSGKTTLALYLIQEFRAAGYAVRYVKRTEKKLFSSPESDTGRVLALGVDTFLWTPDGLRIETPAPMLDVSDMAFFFAGCDVVVVEGGKDLTLPKIWVGRAADFEQNVAGVVARYDPFSKNDANEPGFFCAGQEEKLFSFIRNMLERRKTEEVELISGGRKIPLKDFVARFIAGCVRGMLDNLKGVSPDESAMLWLRRKEKEKETMDTHP